MPPKKEEKKEEKKDEGKAGVKKADKEVKVAKKKKELTEEQLAAAKPSARRAARKKRFRVKLERLIAEYKNILVIKVDNVGSNQMAKVRVALRGHGALLMGKNTLMRKVLRDSLASQPKLEALIPYIYGNVGFCFCNTDLTGVRKIICSNRVPAAAKAGTTAPDDVYVPPGPTGLDPGQTAFFQALNIATKIAKGAIEIINQVHLIKKGDKVTSSSVALLTKLDIKPFFYGILVNTVFEDGSIYDASILDISHDDLLARFFNGVRNIAALGLQIGYPTLASIPHSFAHGYKNLLAVSLATDYTFEESQKFKDYLANPGAFASAKPAAAAGGAKKEEAPAAKEEEEEDGDIGMGGLFD